jgi:polyribonucleotide nucleotidyltransferase
VLCTVVGAKKPKPGQGFFPLTVNYQEKYFASVASRAAFFAAKAGRRKRKR